MCGYTEVTWYIKVNERASQGLVMVLTCYLSQTKPILPIQEYSVLKLLKTLSFREVKRLSFT